MNTDSNTPQNQYFQLPLFPELEQSFLDWRFGTDYNQAHSRFAVFPTPENVQSIAFVDYWEDGSTFAEYTKIIWLFYADGHCSRQKERSYTDDYGYTQFEIMSFEQYPMHPTNKVYLGGK